MNYYSLNKKAPNTTFRHAVINGIAPDRGLYFPESITPLPAYFFEHIDQLSNTEIAFTAIKQFVGDDIPEKDLKAIIEDTLQFDFPLVEVEDNVYSLELFHGPTMAFKDVGARFMARCLQYFNKNNDEKVTVLVATSGDTGGAVASGFLGVKGVDVVILYPKGKVSDIQERQLTTLGQNITALEVDGVFDDCQDMVKSAFLDTDITNSRKLTSANSINVARWMPQLFYFLFAYKRLKKHGQKIAFSVPSGNFGNICAGILAHKLGMPADQFIASTNVNDVVPKFLETGNYEPVASKQTISNAMDVGNPSNFIRIQELYGNDTNALKEVFSSSSYTDDTTKDAMKSIYNKSGYTADPHGAVGYLGLKNYLKDHPETVGAFLETAHPVKFLDVVKETLDIDIAIPEQIQSVLNKKKEKISISDYSGLKRFLLS
ncbi:threonine synthase [Spongiivirga citrea]|uniref:Threonine synthase n=1 Tax=Spongiivirga citrea TaxID=1481457 RepID=A0A6M0CF96_9FLAO|nr:threonine synthase [Spongiivirga citrea]NER16102.1 threonine synthase [Spongiivirga citrea]